MSREDHRVRKPQMREEYDFSDGVRGKYVGRFAESTNVIVLDHDVAEVFSDAKAVNSIEYLVQPVWPPS